MQGVEYTWKSLAEASEEATRKFGWIAAGLFIACAILGYLTLTTHMRYSDTCDYIATNAPAVAVQQGDEAKFARVLLRKYCR